MLHELCAPVEITAAEYKAVRLCACGDRIAEYAATREEADAHCKRVFNTHLVMHGMPVIK